MAEYHNKDHNAHMKYQERHRGVIKDLRGSGHSPQVYTVKVKGEDGSITAQGHLKCSTCGKEWKGWVINRFWGLTPRKPCDKSRSS
jgi:hypothetical protein